MNPPARRRYHAGTVSWIVVSIVFNGLLAGAQGKSEPARVEPRIMVIADQVVQEQWPATLELVNGPTEMTRVEPGQCVRFAVLATGDGPDALLRRMKFGFDLVFSDNTQTFASESAEVVKQIKLEGGDFVTQVLASAEIKNPVPTMVSLAASKARWCAPPDARDGQAKLRGKATTGDGKSLSFEPRTIEVATFETARKNAPFKDTGGVAGWILHYYAAPDPALLWPALRIMAGDQTAAKGSNTMIFFVSALKTSKTAAEDLMLKIPAAEDRHVRFYSAAALKMAGYSMESLRSGFTENEQKLLDSLPQPDPFNVVPDAQIGASQDMLWSVFFATGKIEPVRAIASQLAWADDYRKFRKTVDSGRKPELNDSTFRAVGYGAAGWSLAALSNQAPLVADYLDAIRAAPDTPSAIKNELAHLFDNPAFRSPKGK